MKILDRIDREDRENKYWRIPRASGQVLRSLVLSSGSKIILEIGTSVGYSSIWLASTGARLYTIDSCNERADMAQKHFQEAGLDKKITILRGDALTILKKWKKHIDLVFMDANKNEYHKYYESIFPFIKSKGILIADNVISHKESSREFLELIKKDKRIFSQLLEIDNGLMVVVKK